MIWLSLDCGQDACAVGVGPATGPIAKRIVPMARGHAEKLMPLINTVLQEAGFAFTDIGAVAVPVGPGAFTGLRVALATAAGLEAALSIPVIGVPSCDAMARDVRKTHPSAPVTVILETKRADFYVHSFDAAGAPLGPAYCAPHTDMAGLIEGSAVLAGDAFERLGAAVPLGGRVCYPLICADPESVIILAHQTHQALGGKPPQPVAPLYIREADVSVSKQKLAHIV